MWSTSNSTSFKLPTKSQISTLYSNGLIPKFKGIVYLSLDFGLIWNPHGKKYPTEDSWVWCSSNPNYMIDYITLLWQSKIIPILYGCHINISLAAVILKEFRIPPPIFINISLDVLHKSITNQWKSNSDGLIGTLMIKNPIFELEPNFITYRLGPLAKIGNLVKLDDIGLDPLKHFMDINTPILILLMGQYGCGKTTLAKKLAEKGWYIIDDKEAAAIRIGFKRKKSLILDKFINILQSLKTSSYKGIIIDSTNHRRKDRLIFKKIADENGITYCVKWITRPGHFYNENRSLKVVDSILNMYSDNLELPTIEEEKYDRLV